ncbi:DNA phosphorothioation-dependent restriction protein DptG [Maledivibacter halophilus]|uniref:DNA phosphorothioation-dependent restriction protein DptG n=1 Tax=Maledivibacter halophilus TaxID=36842 RepID=A0A1T5LNL0_9FIRM|nr:DNA phosphorothioation-dependent restriction protein DptG [Maledivibacter halophilus]SKC77556.1 DNA phosphorothioation-dependent restriction protein DptG [Maledivibacter halophilus]
MIEQIRYKINFEEIRKSFQFKETGGLTNSQGKKYRLLPYKANENNLVSNFKGVVGAFSRGISNKEIKEKIDVNLFLDKVAEKIHDYENESSKEKFKDIIETMFIDGDELVNFNIKALNYIYSTKQEENIANFMISVLYSKDLDNGIHRLYNINKDNILYKSVLQSLPEIKEKSNEVEKYNCYLPFIKELFIKDFSFLMQNEETYKSYIKRFIEFYYMFYITQLSIKLSQFQEADLTRPDLIYYTLDWEKTSKNRTAYRLGWQCLEPKVSDLFSHVITLELLNHHGQEKQLGYIEIHELFRSLDENDVANEINQIIEIYKNQLGNDIDWDTLQHKDISTGNKGFDKVYYLFDVVKHQFKKSTRTRANDAYKNWFIKFAKENFAKRRGQLGYNLNITEEDIIFLTKVCIKNREKIKLNLLFSEFEKRGVFFDKDSKERVIQLYEKLNILEKKSDSGDAQYVKSIL